MTPEGISRIGRPEVVAGVAGRLVEIILPRTAGTLIYFVPRWSMIAPYPTKLPAGRGLLDLFAFDVR